jgi:hypothetical protein
MPGMTVAISSVRSVRLFLRGAIDCSWSVTMVRGGGERPCAFG